MAGVAGHAAVGVRELRFVFRHVAPGHAVGAQRFRQARFFAVVRVPRRDRVERLHHFPFEVRVHHGALDKFSVAPLKLPLAPRRAQRFKVRAAAGAAGPDVTSVAGCRNRAVAIDAIDFDCGARLAVKFSGAVAVLLEMAVHALHALFKMNVREVRGFLEFFGSLGETRLFLSSSRWPSRSRANTARKSQPWL